MKWVWLFFLLSYGLSAAEMYVNSTPEGSDVYIIRSNGERKVVGKTPYKGNLEMLFKDGSKGFTIELSKPGFEKYSVFVFPVENADIRIEAVLEIEQSIRLTQDVDFLFGDLLDVVRLIRIKDYTTAKTKLMRLEKKFPYFSVIYEMLGSVSYLQKNFKEALGFYRKAFGINPKNRSVYKMKNYLEKKFNLKKK